MGKPKEALQKVIGQLGKLLPDFTTARVLKYIQDSSPEEIGEYEKVVVIVDDIVNVIGVTTADRVAVVRTLKILSEFGLGSFIVGRRDHPSRFEWTLYSMSKPVVSNVATTGSGKTATLLERAGMAIGGALGLLQHNFAVRPGILGTLLLPFDLTKDEAQRIAEFVKTLPFHERTQEDSQDTEDKQ
jgi:hypothetical protein